jgi:hypothetical protein
MGMAARRSLLTSDRRTRIAIAVVIAAAAAFGIAEVYAARARTPEAIPPLLSEEEDGLRYVFHVPTGTEALFELKFDPNAVRNVIALRPSDAARLRQRLESRWHVKCLSELRSAYGATIQRLRGLGYL